jgi:hypothetical protein
MSMFITNRTRSCRISQCLDMGVPSLMTIVLEALPFMFGVPWTKVKPVNRGWSVVGGR